MAESPACRHKTAPRRPPAPPLRVQEAPGYLPPAGLRLEASGIKGTTWNKDGKVKSFCNLDNCSYFGRFPPPTPHLCGVFLMAQGKILISFSISLGKGEIQRRAVNISAPCHPSSDSRASSQHCNGKNVLGLDLNRYSQ